MAELTGKVGRPEDALAAHRQVLAAREALAAEPGGRRRRRSRRRPEPDRDRRAARDDGKDRRGEATYRRAESAAGGPGEARTDGAGARLANCRSRLGWLLLHTAGRTTKRCRSTAWRGPTRRRWPRPPGRRTRPGVTWRPRSTGSASCCGRRASRPEAEAELRKALAIRQRLADDNPAVTEFRGDLHATHHNLGVLLAERGKASDGGGRVPQGAGDPAEAGRRRTPPSQISAATW